MNYMAWFEEIEKELFIIDGIPCKSDQIEGAIDHRDDNGMDDLL
jgi:hypothetical protein